jgi:hypothetical protein
VKKKSILLAQLSLYIRYKNKFWFEKDRGCFAVKIKITENCRSWDYGTAPDSFPTPVVKLHAVFRKLHHHFRAAHHHYPHRASSLPL